MSVSAKAIRKMVAMGLDAAQIADLCEAIEEGFAKPVELSPAELLTPRQAQNVRAYARRQALKSAESALKNAEKTLNSAPAENAENLLKPAESQRFSAPLARREDNPSISVDPCRIDDEENASAWDRARLDGLASRLREEAGEALNAAAPDLLNLSPIVKLLKGGDGPRCELEADVIPALRVVAAKARKGSIRTWAYFRQAILTSRDERLAGAPAVVVVDFTARAQGPPAGSYAAVEAQQAAMRADVRRQLLEGS